MYRLPVIFHFPQEGMGNFKAARPQGRSDDKKPVERNIGRKNTEAYQHFKSTVGSCKKWFSTFRLTTLAFEMTRPWGFAETLGLCNNR